MDGGHLQASLLSAGVDQLTVLPADTVMVLPSRASELPGTASAVFTRLAEHTGAQLVDTVQYIDLSKAHLTTAHHNMEVSVVSDGHEAAGRVFLHAEYPRWQAVKQRLQLLEDHEVARVLLDLYESTVESEQLAMKADVDQDEYGGDENTRVVHCEISGSARPPPPRILDVRGAGGEMATSCAVAQSSRPATHSAPVAVRARRAARASIPRRDRPCPRSKKPPG
ncbi:uncharacterized protein LOC122376230 [Amphibalanus amphitrite]|uniref:uncharacterized protein LOC122376230 n=1 Tax=Amphibalanus amphitrite TaxID=1232801 RepID=UPI001C8FEFAA|nr:uncharacterized protein LOC122376230 [Amphibalanus amphitrite]